MQIGLYLQDKTKSEAAMRENFDHVLQLTRKHALDLLVLPEGAYTPYDKELSEIAFGSQGQERFARKQIENILVKMIKQSGCPIILSRSDKNGVVYSYYLNVKAKKQETKSRYYLKQVATEKSMLDSEKFGEQIDQLFAPIRLKGFLLGQTIFDDSIFPLFSRLYGRKNVDIIINSSTGHVDYKKWSYYHKVRALENQCCVLSTMAYCDPKKRLNSYVFAYDEKGTALDFDILNAKPEEEKTLHQRDGLYLFSVQKSGSDIPLQFGEDEFIHQEENLNKTFDLIVRPKQLLKRLDKLKKVVDHLYYFEQQGKTIVIPYIREHDILKPEHVASLLYHEKLRDLPEKRYVLFNHWTSLDKNFYETLLSNVLKVRAAENFCAVILHSPSFSKCFQVSNNKNIQVLKMQDSAFRLDLKRTTGPEALWKTKSSPLMKKEWRDNYEKLLHHLLA